MDPNDDPLGIDTNGAGDQSETAEAGAGAPDDGLEQLRKEKDDLYDRLLRKTAEFDNYRKRIDKERRDQAEWAAADVISDVLGALDDFERALAIEAPPEAQAYKAGVELIHRQLAEVLRRRGVTTFDSLGADFDPHLHQAVAYEESPGAREGEVIGELRKGYKLGDRLLRPALVRVAKAS
jgi:molecular chaperone GrpE